MRSIAPEAVERIEVVRGPSAIYGDGATGGVINIITRRPSEERLTFQTEGSVNAALGELEGDSFGNFISQSISGTEGSFDFFGLLSRNRTGVFYDAKGDPIAFPVAEGTAETETLQALGKVGLDFDENQRLQLTANFTRDRYDPSIDSDPSVDDFPPGTRQARAIDYPEPNYIGASDPGTENIALSLNYSNEILFGSQVQAQAYYRYTEINTAYFDERRFDDPRILSFHEEGSEWGGRLQIETPLFEVASVLWGVDYSSEDIFRDNILFDLEEFDNSGRRELRKIGETVNFPLYDVENLGLFAQLQWDVSDRWLVNGGLRYERIGVSVPDFTNEFGEDIRGGNLNFDDVVFNSGVVFKATDELSLYANFAQGFSIPAIRRILINAEEGFDFGRDVDLSQPQKVDNYEIGVRGEWENVQFSLATFYNESELGTTLVRTDPSPIAPLTPIRAPQRNYGVEASIDLQPGEDWQLGGTVTWFEGEVDFPDDGEGFLALNSLEVSPVKLTAYVEHQTTPGWRNRLQALYVGSRDRAFEDDVDPVSIESYFVLDYIGSIQLGPGTLQIGIENLLDNEYTTVASQWEGGYTNSFNFPARGRTVRLGYRITW